MLTSITKVEEASDASQQMLARDVFVDVKRVPMPG
jgi:hypothetical protein